MTTTSGSAKWQGGIKDGKGSISTKSGALKDYPYGFASRFEGKPGSNPEELIGAAHAACFTMALSLIHPGCDADGLSGFDNVVIRSARQREPGISRRNFWIPGSRL
jgi:OsmC subfamily peroxiredoxin